ncbi:MAG: Glucose-6-phosphate isomerase [Chlamydiae bacterium]|nr:Glucose-6-phosphate isomerase [Chlamydiota bacterium]
MATTSTSTGSQLAFTKFRASEKLRTLAQNPFDLTKKGNLTPDRIDKYIQEACGYKLMYATDRITDEVIEALTGLATEAQVIEKMKAMQSGSIMNKIEGFPSEERSVMHTAMRDFFENPHTSKIAKEATEAERVELDKLKAFLKKVDSENRFTDLIMIGIGGSNLGPEAAYRALHFLQKPERNAHFVSNVDPDETARVLDEVDMKNTLVLVVSKSGSTLETKTNYEFMRRKFEEAGLDPQKHFISMTGKGSPLDDSSKFLECFYSWDFIGGRYCTTAMYGAVLLSFTLGFESFWKFLRGANAMDKVALNPNIHENMPLMLAMLSIWDHNFLGAPTIALIPYCSALGRFPAHIQQLAMESNGKHIDRHGIRVDFETGMIFWGEPGTNAQHSFYQLIHQGTPIIPLEFIGFKESQYGDDTIIDGTTNQEKLLGNMFAQSIALATGKTDDNPNKQFEGNRPSRIIFGEQLTPFAMGALFSLYENRVAFEGFTWDINSFDQEGVQLGKVLANRVISSFKSLRDTGKPEGSFPLGDAYLRHLDF